MKKEFTNLGDLVSNLGFERLSDNPGGIVFGTVPFDEIETVPEREWSTHVSSAHPKLPIRGWYLMRLYDRNKPDAATISFLLGYTDKGCWITSAVVAVAPDKMSAVTKSGSLYPLTNPGTGVPDVNLAMTVVIAFRSWGLGKVFEDWPEMLP